MTHYHNIFCSVSVLTEENVCCHLIIVKRGFELLDHWRSTSWNNLLKRHIFYIICVWQDNKRISSREYVQLVLQDQKWNRKNLRHIQKSPSTRSKCMKQLRFKNVLLLVIAILSTDLWLNTFFFLIKKLKKFT